ncbi:MAG: PQQ-binding-like beta-propeller repeat protein [Tannerellaceae bacterium]|jgi:outer membrane protein assembly factor BamB|nr:PQQ-binding-like beta-propeller repeat protein [Tannerellaceae bacterium]
MKRLFFILLTCLLMACAGDSDFSDSSSMDWKLFRGDASLSGYTDTPLPKCPALKWTSKGESYTVSSPVVDNGTTFWCDKQGRIRGVNIYGHVSFEYDLKAAMEATPMIYDSIFYIGRMDGVMTAISLSRKDIIWNYKTFGQISASPNLIKFAGHKSIVFGSCDNYLYCVDAKNGEELDRFESKDCLRGAAGLWKEHIVFGGYDAWVRIIDCKTGIQTDSLLLDALIPASPAIMGDYCYVGDRSGHIYKLMLESGKIIRHKKIIPEEGGSRSFVSVPAISSDAFYFFSGDRYLCAVSRINGKLNWKYSLKGDTGESSPIVCDDKIIVCTKTGVVSILDTDNGKLLWEYDTGEQIIASPAIIKDHFMILTAEGTLFCFGEDEFMI